MAIAKMKKVTLIAANHHQDHLLEAIHELQNLEVIPFKFEELATEQSAIFASSTNDKTLKTTEQQFNRITEAIAFVEQYQKAPSFFKKYSKPRESFSFAELHAKVDSIEVEELLTKVDFFKSVLEKLEQERRMLNDKEETLRKWEKLAFNPKEYQKTKAVRLLLGTIPQSSDNRFRVILEQSEVIAFEEIYHSRDEIGVAILAPQSYDPRVKEDIAKAHFSELNYSFDEKPKQELERVLEQQKQTIEERRATIEEIAKDMPLLYELRLASEVAYNQHQREQAKALLVRSDHLFMLEGWLNETEFETVQSQLKQTLDHTEYALIEQPVTQEEYEQVPIILENNRFVQPFENLTEMYGMPKYGEMDPTPYMMPFYMVFFGMMSGDLGYGLLLWVATLGLLKGLHLERGLKRNVSFFHLLSYPTMIWGVIFGSFFGFDLPFQLLSLSKDLTTIMIISVIFGVIQIMLGLFLGGYANVKRREYTEAYLSNFAWLAIFIGVILMIVATTLVKQPLVTQVGQWMALIAAAGIIIVSIVTTKNKGAGLAKGLYNLYGVSGYVGDIVSYTRLMALAVSGGSIAGAFNMLVGFLPPAIMFPVGVVAFLLLHSLNIFLTFLGSYVHGMRLQFVEYFGKFYSGGGRAFKPFKTYEKYIDIKKYSNKMEEK